MLLLSLGYGSDFFLAMKIVMAILWKIDLALYVGWNKLCAFFYHSKIQTVVSGAANFWCKWRASLQYSLEMAPNRQHQAYQQLQTGLSLQLR